MWVAADDGLADDGTIYKNPAQRADGSFALTTDPDYFPTRHLYTDSKANRALVAFVKWYARHHRLLDKAIAAKAAEREAQHREAARQEQVQAVKEAGPDLLNTLDDVTAALEACLDDVGSDMTPAARRVRRQAAATARDLITRLRPAEHDSRSAA